MNAERAAIHNPLLDPAADERVAAFVARMRAEVVEPWFSAPDAASFQRTAKGHLTTGAILRFRLLAAVGELDEDERDAVMAAWLRPPPSFALDEMQAQAAELLGSERSFMVRRALSMMFADTPNEALIARLQRSADAHLLVGIAGLAASAAKSDVLGLAWMMLLDGSLARPCDEVLEVASRYLLQFATERGTALRRLEREPPAGQDRRLHEVTGATSDWFDAHPGLVPSVGVLLGQALSDGRVESIAVTTTADPEDEALSFLEIELHVRAGVEPSAVISWVQDRALRSGALGVVSDSRGGMVALLARSA